RCSRTTSRRTARSASRQRCARTSDAMSSRPASGGAHRTSPRGALVLGTAGHIDHGKTALVRALTGVDCDRLPEEKRRGITIELGFAPLDLGEDVGRLSVVDVPGHERFVRTMVAGAAGIDFVLLVVAADEGVMPQTREHFEICRLLGVKQGLVVLTKTDLVDDEFLELVNLDIIELVEDSFLENAPVIPVSSKTGSGIDRLRSTLAEIISSTPVRKNRLVTRLPIDRVFTVKGFGAVVTGTLATGSIETGQEMDLLPIGVRVRVRGIQTYGSDVKSAHSGQRTAVNLVGVDHSGIKRGMILAEADSLGLTQIFDAEVEVLKDAKRPLKTRQRVRVHIGTVETFARVQVLNDPAEVKPGDTDLVQFRLEHPISIVPDERFIVRQYSPQMTIAGGRVVDGNAPKHHKRNFDEVRRYLTDLIESGSDSAKLKIILENIGKGGSSFERLQMQTGWQKQILEEALRENIAQKAVIPSENYYVARTPFDRFKSQILDEVERHHLQEPLSRGMLRETLREKTSSHIPIEVFKTALNSLNDSGDIRAEQDIVCSGEHSRELSNDENLVRQNLIRNYADFGLTVPPLENALAEAIRETQVSMADARKIFQLLLDSNELIKVSDEMYFNRKAIDKLSQDLKKYADQNSTDRLIGVAEFKDLAGVSRKYAIPLLEYFDAEKLTRRAGDKRLIM
ncbi:MAG: selenocysteine-specific translation elongation factor, partial [Acidobacteria bacterium]|nr:selenocysteine-specific translation elongation factor [Acidobacteriota bacterium]